MDIYSNNVFANLAAYQDYSGHFLFAEASGYSEELSRSAGLDKEQSIAAAEHQNWLFANELRYSTCPFMVANRG